MRSTEWHKAFTEWVYSQIFQIWTGYQLMKQISISTKLKWLYIMGVILVVNFHSILPIDHFRCGSSSTFIAIIADTSPMHCSALHTISMISMWVVEKESLFTNIHKISHIGKTCKSRNSLEFNEIWMVLNRNLVLNRQKMNFVRISS